MFEVCVLLSVFPLLASFVSTNFSLRAHTRRIVMFDIDIALIFLSFLYRRVIMDSTMKAMIQTTEEVRRGDVNPELKSINLLKTQTQVSNFTPLET